MKQSGKVLTVIVPKRAGLILTIFVFATLVSGSGNTTDLRLRISGTPFTMASSNNF
jgi:hypothetical protein